MAKPRTTAGTASSAFTGVRLMTGRNSRYRTIQTGTSTIMVSTLKAMLLTSTCPSTGCTGNSNRFESWPLWISGARTWMEIWLVSTSTINSTM